MMLQNFFDVFGNRKIDSQNRKIRPTNRKIHTRNRKIAVHNRKILAQNRKIYTFIHKKDKKSYTLVANLHILLYDDL